MVNQELRLELGRIIKPIIAEDRIGRVPILSITTP
jgi:hypothetical protein